MSKRFIVDENNIDKAENILIVGGEEVHHINVLRYKIGDKVYINNYELEIQSITKDTLVGKVIGNMPKKGEPKVQITLIQSYLKSDKMDYVVQKAVELGAKNIIPVISKNTVVKLDEKDKMKKKERLTKIAKEAIEQCGRTDNVTIDNVTNLNNIDFKQYDLILVCHERSNNKLKDIVKNINDNKNIAVIIGPEGGLEQNEVDNILNKNKNCKDILLGDRVLRAETASFMILSVLSYELE